MSNIKHELQQQRGVALIIVLLIVALVSVLATQMGSRLQLQVKRASNIKDNNQAYWYAMGAEQYAQKSIKFLLENSDGVINLNQQWSEPFVTRWKAAEFKHNYWICKVVLISTACKAETKVVLAQEPDLGQANASWHLNA